MIRSLIRILYSLFSRKPSIVFEVLVPLPPGAESGIEVVRINGVTHTQYVSPPYHVIEARIRARKTQ